MNCGFRFVLFLNGRKHIDSSNIRNCPSGSFVNFSYYFILSCFSARTRHVHLIKREGKETVIY